MNATAYLVMGPETSGNRWLTSMFVDAGCAGTDEHAQPLDDKLPFAQDAGNIVLRRSFPYWGRWPDISKQVLRMRGHGYTVRAVVIIRDWQITCQGQVRAGYVPSAGASRANMKEALGRIVHALQTTGIDYTVITYESLLLHPQNAVESLFHWAGLPAPTVEAVDGNAKYYEVDYAS